MRSRTSLAFLLIAALAACSPREATSSYVEGWMPASGRWFAIQWDGKAVPFTIQVGDLASTVDSARIIVGPGDRAMYIIDSHMSDGYVGHDTLTGKFELLDFLEPQETRLFLDSGPMTQTWNFAMNGDSLIVHRGHTDVYMQ